MPRPFHELVTKRLMAEGVLCEALPYQRATTTAQVHAYLFAGPQLTGDAPIVVYAHGTGNDCLYPQLSLFRALVRQGLRVFSFDLDGHGCQSTTLLSLSTITSCLANACNVVQARYPTATLHLVGHSLGGALALAFASASVATHLPLASLSLIATPVYLKLTSGAALAELLSLANRSLYRQIGDYGLYHLLPAVARFKRQQYPIRIQSDDHHAQRPKSFAYLATVARLFDQLQLTDCARDVTLPTLLCYGGGDRIAPPVHGRLLARSIGGNAHYLRLTRETHFTTLFAPALEAQLCQWISACQQPPPRQRRPLQAL